MRTLPHTKWPHPFFLKSFLHLLFTVLSFSCHLLSFSVAAGVGEPSFSDPSTLSHFLLQVWKLGNQAFWSIKLKPRVSPVNKVLV